MGSTISAEAIGQLQAQLSGQVLAPGDPGYEEARQVHNGMIDKRPALIARCQNTADIVDAVNLGRDAGVEVAVRGGGHNVAGLGVTDGGLMIDLQPMKGTHVDPASRRVRAQAGLTWSEYNRATHAFGLATTGGVISSTGIAGLTLGGGIGWTMGKYGMAVDNLTSAEIVTADGQVRTASQVEDADLFWAVRGGGGNFGVASSFEYQAHPLSTVMAGLIAFPLPDAPKIFDFYRDFTIELPDDLTVFCALVHAPDGSGHKISALGVCHCGDLAAAEKDVAPVKTVSSPLIDLIGPMPYPVVNTLLDPGFPKGARNYWKAAFFKELSDDAVAIMINALETAPSIMSGMVVEHFHGHVTRIAPTDTAYPFRQPGYNLVLTGEWMEPADDEANVAWVRETFAALQPYMADAGYVNYLGGDEGDRVRSAYGPNWERLVELKRRYDPDNLFHLNQNIDPVAG